MKAFKHLETFICFDFRTMRLRSFDQAGIQIVELGMDFSALEVFLGGVVEVFSDFGDVGSELLFEERGGCGDVAHEALLRLDMVLD